MTSATAAKGDRFQSAMLNQFVTIDRLVYLRRDGVPVYSVRADDGTCWNAPQTDLVRT